MVEPGKLIQALQFLSENLEKTGVEKRGLPVSWMITFLAIAEAGKKGILMTDLSPIAGVGGPIVCRITKFLSETEVVDRGKVFGGAALITLEQDDEYRHRKRAFLTEHGRKLYENMQAKL